MEKHISTKDIALILILFLIGGFMLLGVISSVGRVIYYGAAIQELNSSEPKSGGTSIFIDGKDKMDAEYVFDKYCYINLRRSYDDGSEWLAASKAMYDTVNIQLYRVTLTDPVDTEINSNIRAKLYCQDYVETLPNADNAIVIYDYIPEDYESNIYIDNVIYYGDNVFKYLTSTDMEMIDTILYNDYELFPDYTTRVVREWELIANNLVNGYDRNLYDSDSILNMEWDISYYKEQQMAAFMACIAFALVGLLLIKLAFNTMYSKITLANRAWLAEIEQREAENVKTILEAEIPDVTQDLVNKYLDED